MISIAKVLKEISKKDKELLGRGLTQAVYPHSKDDNVVIKYFHNGKQISQLKKMYAHMAKYPDCFPIVYKLTDTYTIVEKIDVSTIKPAIEKLLNYLNDNLHNYFSNDNQYQNYFLMNILKIDSAIIKQIIKESPNPSVTERFFELMKHLCQTGIVNRKNPPDIHEEQFGTDKNGTIKLIDF